MILLFHYLSDFFSHCYLPHSLSSSPEDPLLFFQHARHNPTSGPLHTLYLLLRELFPQMSAWPTVSCSSNLCSSISFVWELSLTNLINTAYQTETLEVLRLPALSSIFPFFFHSNYYILLYNNLFMYWVYCLPNSLKYRAGIFILQEPRKGPGHRVIIQ